MEIHDNMNVLLEKAVAGGALVEIERLAATQNRNARHVDVHAIGIELHSGASGGGEDAAPVGIASREGSLHERRSGDGLADAPRCGFALCATHFNFDNALRAFAVGDNLQCE